MKALIAVMGLAVVMGGCASSEDVAMIEAHYAARTNFDTQQTAEISDKSNDIRAMMNFDCTDAAGTEACGALKAMGKMWASEKIANIQRAEFGEKKPRTSIQAQEAVGVKLLNGIPVITMGVVSYKAVAESEGQTNINADNGSTVSTTYEEQHATSLAEGASAVNQPNQDNSSVTEVIESEVEEPTEE